MKKVSSIKNINRILLVVGAMALLVVIKVPMWRIDLNAPQYPEGLKLFIYPNHLGGNVDIINGLNHYIGMKSLHTADFFEFKILVPIIIGFSVLLLIAAIVGKRWILQTVFVLFALFGIIAMYDFWRWEYNYGHNLNPDAAIVIPGMAYQPPMIGFKQLLNFGAYSIPALGGFLFAGVGVLLLAVNIFEFRNKKRIKRIITQSVVAKPAVAVILAAAVFLSSCNASTQPIVLGKDNCSYCKMPFGDARFGAEAISSTGKVYKFDDAHCLRSFISENSKPTNNWKIYFVDFGGKHDFIDAQKAFYLKSESFRTPMNGNIAAFQTEESLQQAKQEFGGNTVTWKGVIQ
jgi:copper chaperone NosL